MSRVLDPELQALIDSGHCEDHTAVVITLGDGTTILRLATAEVNVDGDLFLANLKETEGLKMSLTRAYDRTKLSAQNVDKVLGQQLTGMTNSLEGATAMLGHIFIDPRTGTVYYDEKLPGDILTGQVDEETVELSFVADIYGGMVVGDTVGSVFPYQDPTPAEDHIDPNDLIDPNDRWHWWLEDDFGRLPALDTL